VFFNLNPPEKHAADRRKALVALRPADIVGETRGGSETQNFSEILTTKVKTFHADVCGNDGVSTTRKSGLNKECGSFEPFGPKAKREYAVL